MDQKLKERIESLTAEEKENILKSATVNSITGVSFIVEKYCLSKGSPQKITDYNLGGKKI